MESGLVESVSHFVVLSDSPRAMGWGEGGGLRDRERKREREGQRGRERETERHRGRQRARARVLGYLGSGLVLMLGRDCLFFTSFSLARELFSFSFSRSLSFFSFLFLSTWRRGGEPGRRVHTAFISF